MTHPVEYAAEVERDGRLRADAARNRERVLRTAREAMAEGDLSLQLNDIARRAGVGVGTVYRHFPTPRALLESAVEDALRALLTEAERAGAEPDPWTGVERVLHTLIDLQLTDAGAGEVLASTEDSQPWVTQLKHDLDRISERLLARVRKAGLIQASVESEDLRLLLCGVAYAARSGTGDPRVRARRYLTVVLDGLRT
jgi:AcrR family transcriptional regulator